MRFGVREVPLEVDSEWRDKMSRKDRAIVSALTAPLRSRYEYRG